MVTKLIRIVHGTKCSFIQDLTTPEIQLFMKNETAQCASCNLGYKAALVTVVWLVSRIVYTRHIDELQRHHFIYFPSNFQQPIVLGTCESQCRLLTAE